MLYNNPEECSFHLLRGGNLRSLTKDYRSSVGGIKQPEREANHSPAPSAEACNEWNYTSVFTVHLHGVDRENFTLLIESVIRVTIM